MLTDRRTDRLGLPLPAAGLPAALPPAAFPATAFRSLLRLLGLAGILGLLASGGAFAQTSPGAAVADSAVADSAGGGADRAPPADSLAWRHPPMPATMPMIPPLAALSPSPRPFLPGAGIDPSSLPAATFRRVVTLSDGDTLRLEARRVRRTIGDRTFVMYGFNGQYPGPLIRVPRDATITVDFHNGIGLPTTIHWHGVRLDNRFDGVPGVTQDPVPPGGSFVYEVRFPDAGIYWYHPHMREDIQQDLGLYGNILVDAPDSDFLGPANREEVLMLDDLLVDDGGLFPYGREAGIHALMGRFGNVFLVNGEPGYDLEVSRGEVVRFYLTNVANTRTFNLRLEGAELKVVGADIGRFQREERVESVVIAPAQRYIVDARFPEAGTVALLNRIQALDHFAATFYEKVDTLGMIRVREAPADPDHGAAFERLREPPGVAAEIEGYRAAFDRPVDRELSLTVRAAELPSAIVRIMSLDTLYVPPVEWNDAMPMMNYASSSREVTWILRDEETGAENREIQWTFREGEVYRIRIHNRRRSFHPMQHPIHLHGQRFLVLSRDGVPNENLAWKDTALIPVGSTFDLLLEASNPGEWMLHCHIAEHLEAGMAMTFEVVPREAGGEGPGPEDEP